MKLSERLQNVTRVFLDTACVIYFVEKNPQYVERARVVFDQIDNGTLVAVASPVTLAESLVHPYQLDKSDVAQSFTELLVDHDGIEFVSIDDRIADKAANLRARYNLSLTDAFQVAVAIAASCDAFLTNDIALKRVKEINVIVLGEMDAE